MNHLTKRLLACLLAASFCGASAMAASNTHEAKRQSLPAIARHAKSATININTADQASLMQLKGIGKVHAAAIINYRKQHGDFKSLQGLMNVKGFSAKRLASLIKENPELIAK